MQSPSDKKKKIVDKKKKKETMIRHYLPKQMF